MGIALCREAENSLCPQTLVVRLHPSSSIILFACGYFLFSLFFSGWKEKGGWSIDKFLHA